MKFCPLIKSDCKTDCVFNNPSGCQISLTLTALSTDATALIKTLGEVRTVISAMSADLLDNGKSK